MTWPLGFEIPASLVHYFSPLLAIWPPAGHNNQTETVEQLNKGLDSGEVENRKSLKVYLKEDLPSRLH